MRQAPPSPAKARTPRAGLRFLLPIAVFVLLAIVLGIGLTLNPREVPSPLVGKPVPVFDLPPVKGRSAGLASRDLVGQVALLNVFASWCAACKEEHPVLVELARRNIVAIHGLNYKDKPDDAEAWLNRWGDPYTRTGADVTGEVGIDWDVYGVPETFVIDRSGSIAYKHIGPLTPAFVRETLLPMVDRLNGLVSN